MPGSSKWSLSIMFPHQNPVYASPLVHTCPAQLILHDLITRTILGEVYRSISYSLCSFFPCLVTSPQHPILKHTEPSFLPHCEQPSFSPIQKNRQNYNCIFEFSHSWIANQKTKDSAPNDSKHSLTSSCF